MMKRCKAITAFLRTKGRRCSSNCDRHAHAHTNRAATIDYQSRVVPTTSPAPRTPMTSPSTAGMSSLFISLQMVPSPAHTYTTAVSHSSKTRARTHTHTHYDGLRQAHTFSTLCQPMTERQSPRMQLAPLSSRGMVRAQTHKKTYTRIHTLTTHTHTTNTHKLI
jgi:hypothetical protein